MFSGSLICFQTIPKKSGRRSCVLSDISCHMGAKPYVMKNFIVAALNPVLVFLHDASVHMDTHTAPLEKAQDGCKIYWDSKKTGCKTNFQFGSKYDCDLLQSDW